MTQTGGLVILLAWVLFGAILAVLAYFLLRHQTDPLQEITAPPDSELSPLRETPPADDTPENPPDS